MNWVWYLSSVGCLPLKYHIRQFSSGVERIMADNVKVAVRIRSIISFMFTNLKEICEYQNGYLFLYLFNNGKQTWSYNSIMINKTRWVGFHHLKEKIINFRALIHITFGGVCFCFVFGFVSSRRFMFLILKTHITV